MIDADKVQRIAGMLVVGAAASALPPPVNDQRSELGMTAWLAVRGDGTVLSSSSFGKDMDPWRCVAESLEKVRFPRYSERYEVDLAVAYQHRI